MAHAFNVSTPEGRGRRISEFEASLVLRASFRTSRATQKNHVSKQTNKQKGGGGSRKLLTVLDQICRDS